MFTQIQFEHLYKSAGGVFTSMGEVGTDSPPLAVSLDLSGKKSKSERIKSRLMLLMLLVRSLSGSFTEVAKKL